MTFASRIAILLSDNELGRKWNIRHRHKATLPLVAGIFLFIVLVSLVFAFKPLHNRPFHIGPFVNHTIPPSSNDSDNAQGNSAFDWRRDSFKYGLDDHQCDVAFLRLFQDIDIAVEHRRGRNVTLQDIDDHLTQNGTIRAMIFDGQVRV